MGQTATVGNHCTTVRQEQNILSLVYHQTEVVKADQQSITLKNGGWWTLTTKTRMNQCSRQYGFGYEVYQRDHNWYAKYKGKEFSFSKDGVLVLER